jgi:small-conductance mechanosensitive channel
MTDNLILWFLSTDREILTRIAVSLLIFASSFFLNRLLNHFLYRWQKRLVNRLSKKNAAAVSSVETKVITARRMIAVTIYFLAFVLFLMQFQAVKNLGAGLLASAGVAGIVIGLAAQTTLSNLVAGVSVSFAQPIRLNDAVIFNDDWGVVEEISLMHTIIRTWDNRRIMVPNSILVNSVIENWTIKDPSLVGKVMLYVDYTCDVEKVKFWVKEIVEQSQYSDSDKIAVVQIVDFTEKTMVLRILCKASDPPKAFQLRCEIREKIIKKFRQAGMPLPVVRIKKPEGLSGKPQDAF